MDRLADAGGSFGHAASPGRSFVANRWRSLYDLTGCRGLTERGVNMENRILDAGKYKPIRNLGIFLFIIGCIFTLPLIYLLDNTDLKLRAIYIAMVFALSHWHILTGLFIIIRKKAGYRFLLFYLKFLKFLYPFGTAYSNNMLVYIEKNNIENYFI